MVKKDMAILQLPSDWVAIPPQDAAKFEAELDRELCPEHLLYGVQAKALARKRGRDDFLFCIPAQCFAQVHLTWSHETNAAFPSADFFLR